MTRSTTPWHKKFSTVEMCRTRLGIIYADSVACVCRNKPNLAHQRTTGSDRCSSRNVLSKNGSSRTSWALRSVTGTSTEFMSTVVAIAGYFCRGIPQRSLTRRFRRISTRRLLFLKEHAARILCSPTSATAVFAQASFAGDWACWTGYLSVCVSMSNSSVVSSERRGNRSISIRSK